MSERKSVPIISRDNLIPPYKTYKFFTADDDPGTRLRVDDATNGFNCKVDGASNLFDRESKDFRMVNAWWLADVSTLVYDNPTRVKDELLKAGFTRVEFTDSALENQVGQNDTQCFVASNDDLVVVAFRGTESGLRPEEDRDPEGRKRPPDFTHIFNDWLVTNSNFKLVPFDSKGANKGQVHNGFKRALDDVFDKLESHLIELNDGRRTFWFTGHSLGAALAVLAVAKCDAIPNFDMHGLYTYGNPLTGDEDFVKFFDGVLAKHGMGYFRFMNNGDIVTTVPPKIFGFRHTGTLKFINDRGKIVGGVGQLERLANLAGGVLNHTLDVFGGR